MKAIRMDIDLSSSGLGSGGSTPLEGNGGGLTRNGRPSSFGNVFASGGGGKGGGTDKITATTTATTMAGDELSVRGATVLRTAPPTAFTISFNDEHAQLGGQVSIAEVSLQEAARQAPKGRRLMLSRKNENVNKQKQQQLQDSGSECGGDPKRWLFRKMMMGRKGETATKSSDRRRRRSGSAISEATTSTTMSGGGGHETTTEEGQEDLASEAGTYVVENKIKTTEATTTNDVMTTSQISGVSNKSSNRTTQRCYDSDSDSSSSTHASTHTSSTGRTPSPGNPPISATTTTTNIRPPLTISGQVGKRSLMSDLRQLRESGQIEKPSIINQQSASNIKVSNKKIPPKTLGVLPTTTKLASTAPPIPPHRGNSAGVTTTNSNQNPKKNTTVFASNPIPFSRPCRCPTQHQQLQQQQQQQAFRRNDGGRFSMRPTSATRANTNALRQTASSNAAKLKAAEEEKMLGWLRRKEYDPRRAVAEAEQQQQQQQHLLLQQQQLRKQQEAFTSNRSISATLTNQEQQQNSKQQSSFSRWKAAQQKQQQVSTKPPLESHRSHDELNRLAEVCDDEDDSIGLTSDSCNTSLQRTVDELTQKCHKSIALLKLCNQSSLSPSVEHLLERVAQTGVLTEEGSKIRGGGGDVSCAGKSGVTSSNENISDRLEQLSSAFDAIQKYLEEQTTTTFSGQQKQQQSPQRTFSGTFVVKKSRSGG
ncbi:unnamed protein product [Meloidogyne enterolobii]|uniref:Uncharacterized protein n=1 Tax=Meloidogyne enterolobii TaxID=390850 RepID=A0ACB0Y0G1_MELEN